MKPFWQSKTVLIAAMNILMAALGLSDWVASNPDDYMVLVSGVILLLRFVSKDKVTFR